VPKADDVQLPVIDVSRAGHIVPGMKSLPMRTRIGAVPSTVPMTTFV